MKPEKIEFKGNKFSITAEVKSRGINCNFEDIKIGEMFENRVGNIICVKTGEQTAFVFTSQKTRRIKPYLPVTLVANVRLKYNEQR